MKMTASTTIKKGKEFNTNVENTSKLAIVFTAFSLLLIVSLLRRLLRIVSG